jgi:hypothetical protein
MAVSAMRANEETPRAPPARRGRIHPGWPTRREDAFLRAGSEQQVSKVMVIARRRRQ